jgi:hypothetical protein
MEFFAIGCDLGPLRFSLGLQSQVLLPSSCLRFDELLGTRRHFTLELSHAVVLLGLFARCLHGDFGDTVVGRTTAQTEGQNHERDALRNWDSVHGVSSD